MVSPDLATLQVQPSMDSVAAHMPVVLVAGEPVLDASGPAWAMPQAPMVHESANDDAFATLDRQYREQYGRLIGTARSRVATLRRLTALRRANEELQNCFHALERHLPADANDLSLSYADELGTPDVRLNLGWSSNGLAQVLPVSSAGVSAIELHLSALRPSVGATLHVHLVSLENHRVIDRWTVPLEQLSQGWAMFCLTRPLVGPTRTLELRIDVECDADVNVSLSLGREQRIGAFQARNPVTNAAASERSLAMRVWCGDANSAHARKTNIVVADSQPSVGRGVVETPLSPTLLSRVEHVTAAEVRFSFEPVSWVPYRVAIACHPPAKGITLAALPLLVDGRIRSVLADVEVGNPKSKTVEFALVIADDPERARALFEQGAEARADEGFSGWTEADPGQVSQIAASLTRPAGQAMTLFLATRMKVPGNKDFAWARFRKLSLRTAL